MEIIASKIIVSLLQAQDVQGQTPYVSECSFKEQ